MISTAEPNNHRQGTTCRRTDGFPWNCHYANYFSKRCTIQNHYHPYYKESRYKSQNQIFIDRARLAAGQLDSIGTATTQHGFSIALQHDLFQS